MSSRQKLDKSSQSVCPTLQIGSVARRGEHWDAGAESLERACGANDSPGIQSKLRKELYSKGQY